MKNSIQLFALIIIVASLNSCKGDKTQDSKVGEAAEVAITTENSRDFTLNPNCGQILWSGTKPGKKHTGTIGVLSGEIATVDGKITSGHILLDMNTLTSTDLEGNSKTKLENHLKGLDSSTKDDFFNVTEYPTAKFEMTKITEIANDPEANHLIYGNLTIKDVTKEIGFKATVTIRDIGIRVLSKEFKINRTDWGIKYQSKNFIEGLKDQFIDDEIGVELRISIKDPITK